MNLLISGKPVARRVTWLSSEVDVFAQLSRTLISQESIAQFYLLLVTKFEMLDQLFKLTFVDVNLNF